MGTSIRDWQKQGVTLTVELATSGALTVGGNSIQFPFNSGRVGGAPVGWTAGEYPFPGDTSKYNYTTASNVFSVSAKTMPIETRYAGIWSQSFTIIPGFRYQVAVQARLMAGKTPTNYTVNLDYSYDGGSTWLNYIGAGNVAQANWQDVLGVGAQPIPSGYTLGRLTLWGSPPQGNLGMWGTQFQGLYVTQLDLAPPSIVWHDITCDVQSLGIRYGRERFTNRYDVASLAIQLLNNDGQYSFHDPHPLGLQPGRQVRVTATYKGKTYPLAFHVLDSITDGYTLDGRVISQWQCVDPTTVLSNANVATSQAYNLIGGGKRIGVLLDQVGYVPRLLDPGTFWLQQIIASGSSVRDECGLTADSEGGNFFADRQGNCVYKDRNWRATDTHLTQVQADLVGYPAEGSVMPIVDDTPTAPGAPLICTRELVTDWSLARVVNLVTLAKAGGNAQTFEDKTSQKQYGPHTYQRLDFVLENDSDLPIRAADIMSNYTDPVLRVNSVAYAPGVSGAWEWTLGVFLNWLVRVWYSHPTEFWGFAVCVHIQSVEHRITPDDWYTTLTVDLPESFTEVVWAPTSGWDAGIWDEALWDSIG